MRKVLILHGTQGSPDGNWFRWLQQELTAKNLDVWLPELPNASHPSLKEWFEFVDSHCPFKIDEETLIIGHSSGAILALVLAQGSIGHIGGLVCVSVFYDNSLKWQANDRLFDIDFNYQAITKQARTRLVIHSDDDPYVPLEQAKLIANRIEAEFLLLPGQGHFNLEKSPEYSKFPKLLQELEKRKLV